jgi:hypothetical protein
LNAFCMRRLKRAHQASYSLLKSPHSSICWFQSGGKLCLSDCSHGREGEAVATLTIRQILPTLLPPSKLWQNNYLPPSHGHSSLPLWCVIMAVLKHKCVRPYLTRRVPGFWSIQIPRVVF